MFFISKGERLLNQSKIYILLTDTGSLLGRTIKKYTKAPYNHASIAFDTELEELYSFGRKHPRNPLYAGFVKEDVINGTFKYFPNTTCALYELEITDRQLQKINRIINQFKKKQQSYNYNLLGLIGVALNESIEPDGFYFCSQFVAEVLNRSGIKLFDTPPSLVTPDHLRNLQTLHLVYEGKLYEYQPIKSKLECEKTA